MVRLRAVYFAALAAVLSLAATATANAAAVNYGSQTTANVTVFYSNLPANTQLFLRNQVNGGELIAAVPPVSGAPVHARVAAPRQRRQGPRRGRSSRGCSG